MSQLGKEKDAAMRAEEEAKLLEPIRAHVGEIQARSTRSGRTAAIRYRS